MNDNLFVVTTDWHLTSSDSETGGLGETKPSQASAVATYIRDTLAPAGCIDMGDCKDHYGTDTGDEHDNYIANVQNTLPYSDVFAAEMAQFPILPGNHDEIHDYNDGSTGNDLSLFDARFWGAPYHWCVNWYAPKIRFIAIHSYIHHSQDGFAGFAHVTTAELDWLQNRIDEMPANWRAIICSHFAATSVFGNEIRFTDNVWNFANPTGLTLLLTANASRISAYLSGHRHANMNTTVVNGIPHFNCPSMAYTAGNVYGGFVPITYDPAARTLSLDYLYGPPHPGGYTRFAGYTPLVGQLPLATKVAKVRAA